MFDLSCDRFQDQSVSELMLTRRAFCYEGSTTTGKRVAPGTVRTGKKALGKSRAKTKKGQQNVLKKAGVANKKGVLNKTIEGRQLTPSELNARTAARKGKREAGTRKGRRKTARTLRTARFQGAAKR